MEGSEFWIGQRMEDGGMGDGVGRVGVRTGERRSTLSGAAAVIFTAIT